MAAITRQDRITPENQLDLLLEPMAQDIVDAGLSVSAVALLVTRYVDSIFTNWHTALGRLTMLPEKIPQLPLDIHQILEQPCPISGDKTKEDGTPYKVRETHSLFLLPSGMLNAFEARAKAYGEANRADYEEQNPFQFIALWSLARGAHGTTEFDEYQWILAFNGLIDGSRNQTYAAQIQMLEALNDRATANYTVPSLREALEFSILHKVVVGGEEESVLPEGNQEKPYTYTRVQEFAANHQLSVGGFGLVGLRVQSSTNSYPHIGLLPLRRLEGLAIERIAL